jgi:hypothetical protein
LSGHGREAELKAQIQALLNKARAADEAEKNEPELDIPAEIARRQDRLEAIAAARARLEQRQREADLERGRSDDNGWIKNVLGFRQFSMRGLHRVQAEWKLVCMALNLRRMATMRPD